MLLYIAILMLFFDLVLFVFCDNSTFTQIIGKKSAITIYAYDKIKGYLNWMQPWFIEAAIKKCSTRCYLTDSAEDLIDADIVIFHAPTHISVPPRSPNNLLYILLSMEQPLYAKLLTNYGYLSKNFDYLATYSRKETYPNTDIPNIPITYYPLNILHYNAVMSITRTFKQKDGYNTGVTVAVFVSNCKAAGASTRLQYLEELMKYIPIHSYGNCLNNRVEPTLPEDKNWPPQAQKRARKIKILSHYKFYLAFENARVEDYVSEKVFEGLFAGTVPVYIGSPTINDFMPSNDSFINANNLTPRQLADLLISIGNDINEYNKFFNFKKQMLSQHFINMALQSYIHPNILCRLCEYALLVRNSLNN